MPYESPRKIFRDMNKNPDECIDFEEKALIKEELEKDELLKRQEDTDFIANNGNNEGKNKKDPKPETSEGKAFKNSVDNIFAAGLLEGENDDAEEKIIKQRQEITLTYLGKILDDVKNYISQIGFSQMEKMSGYDDIKKYQTIIKELDETRRSYHNKLISDIKIASRLININFNADFPEDLRLRGESQMPDRKGLSVDDLRIKMAKRKYFKFNFPVGAFIDLSKAPKDPQGEREYIAHWAFMMYFDLSVLEKEARGVVSEIKENSN